MAEPFAPAAWPGVALRLLPPARRWVLRADPGADPALAGRLGAAFLCPLPGAMLTACRQGGRAALRLGPDEWLLLADPGDDPAPALEAACAGAPASIVDVSDGALAFALEGPSAALLLAEGCPLDLDALPAGGCTRTLFGRIGILLWRPDAAAHVHVEVARSFAAPLWQLLADAAADLGG